MEEWKPFPGNPMYDVSSTGRVRNSKRGAILIQVLRSNGYLSVGLIVAGKQKTFSSHRVVLEAFCGSCPIGFEAMHLNGCRIDNRVENLRWGTRRENHSHKRRHGTAQIGNKNPNVKWTAELVQQVRESELSSIKLSECISVPSSTIRQIRGGRTWKHVG
jgi:hypothetical protein